MGELEYYQVQTPETWEFVASDLQRETALDLIHPSVEHTHPWSGFAENKTKHKIPISPSL